MKKIFFEGLRILLLNWWSVFDLEDTFKLSLQIYLFISINLVLFSRKENVFISHYRTTSRLLTGQTVITLTKIILKGRKRGYNHLKTRVGSKRLKRRLRQQDRMTVNSNNNSAKLNTIFRPYLTQTLRLNRIWFHCWLI